MTRYSFWHDYSKHKINLAHFQSFGFISGNSDAVYQLRTFSWAKGILTFRSDQHLLIIVLCCSWKRAIEKNLSHKKWFCGILKSRSDQHLLILLLCCSCKRAIELESLPHELFLWEIFLEHTEGPACSATHGIAASYWTKIWDRLSEAAKCAGAIQRQAELTLQ